MLHKIKQYVYRSNFTASNRLPSSRSRKFLINSIRWARYRKPSATMRAAMGFLRWAVMLKFRSEDRTKAASICFITARPRGTYKRYSVSRTRVRHLAMAGRLFGVRKASW